MSKKNKPLKPHQQVPQNEESGEWCETCDKRKSKCNGVHKKPNNEPTNSSNNYWINYWNNLGNK
jgi:hypothetical protein